MSEEIFSRDKYNRRLRELLWAMKRRLSVKVRWTLLAVTLAAIIIPSIAIPANYVLSHTQLAQNADEPPPDEAIEPIDEVYEEEEYIDEDINLDMPDEDTDTPKDLGGTFAAIASANEQLHNMIGACVQRKEQVYGQLVAQNQQLDQLEDQQEDLEDEIADLDYDDDRLPALERQSTQLQTAIDRQSDTIANTEELLSDGIADCQDAVDTLQGRIDDLETTLGDNMDVLLEYELPE